MIKKLGFVIILGLLFVGSLFADGENTLSFDINNGEPIVLQEGQGSWTIVISDDSGVGIDWDTLVIAFGREVHLPQSSGVWTVNEETGVITFNCTDEKTITTNLLDPWFPIPMSIRIKDDSGFLSYRWLQINLMGEGAVRDSYIEEFQTMGLIGEKILYGVELGNDIMENNIIPREAQYREYSRTMQELAESIVNMRNAILATRQENFDWYYNEAVANGHRYVDGSSLDDEGERAIIENATLVENEWQLMFGNYTEMLDLVESNVGLLNTVVIPKIDEYIDYLENFQP